MKYLHDVYLENLNVMERMGGFYFLKKGGKWENRHRAFEQNKFYYVTDGEFSIKVENKTYHAKKGMWFFIPAGILHSYHNFSDKVMEKYWIHFDLYPDLSILKEIGLNHCVTVPEDSIVPQLFSEYAELKETESLTDRIKIKALILRLLCEYIELSKNSGVYVEDQDEARIDKVLSYINYYLDKEIKNEELAKLCFLHPNHFVRFFKKRTGTTPRQYILMRRIETAKNFIEQTELSMAEIAEKMGFCDAAHFSREFKKFYSMTPRQYYKECIERKTDK